MLECLLCLESNQDVLKCIKVESTQWEELCIKKMIDKHLWPIDIGGTPSFLCATCWEELNGFHKFYTRIEEAHINYKWFVKTEIEEEKWEEESKPKDLILEQAFEPETIINHTVDAAIVVKQENEQPTVMCKYESDSCDASYSDDYLPLMQTRSNFPNGPNQGLAKNNANPTEYDETSYMDCTLTNHQGVAKVCDICGQTMPDSYSFKRHMEEHDTTSSSTSAKCDECGLILSGSYSLKRHKNLKHPPQGNRDYTCHICMKVSPNMKALRKHIQCTHERGYDYKCNLCEKAFKRSDHLRGHMSVHTGNPLYRCPWCSKMFNSNGNMHSHRKKMHPIEWEEARRKKYSGNLPPHFTPPTVVKEKRKSKKT